MKRKAKTNAQSNDRVSPKDGTEATTSTRGRRKIKISEQSELNGFKPTSMSKGENSKEINSKKTENKILQIKLLRCDEMEPTVPTEQKGLKISARKNIKKMKDSCNATGNIKTDKDFDTCTPLGVAADDNSNQGDEIKTKSKTELKKMKNLKEHEGENSSKATENLETDEDFITKPNSKTALKKLKNSKPEVSSKATGHVQKNEYNKTKSKRTIEKLKNSEENSKFFEDNATEKDEDVELCDDSEVVNSSKEEDEIKPKSKASVKRSKNSKRTKKSTISETSENMKPNNEVFSNDVTEVQINVEKSESSQESFKILKCNDSELPVDAAKAVKSVPNITDKGNKRKRGKQSGDTNDEDVRPTKSAKKEKDSGKSKSSKEKIPDVTAIDFSNDSKSPSGNVWNFKISSWNVNGIRAWLEKNGLSFVHHEKPDIICIQETKCSDDKLPEEIREIEGYHTYWLSGDKDGYSGVGLISKQQPIEVEYGIGISEHDGEGRVITAEYEKFYLVAAYVPNAGRKLVRLDYRKKWDEDFRAYLKKLDAKKPVILCGDLNVAHEEIDLANPKTNKKNAGFTKEEREGFSALLKEGFTDTFRQLYPNVTGAYTFWTYMLNARAKNVGWRLDYFVVSERFCENLCDNVIRKDVLGSDHCPITLFLSL